METIVSDTGIAAAAVTDIQAASLNEEIQISLSKSNISSMTQGIEINHRLLSDLAQLIECVKEQSQQFPKIADIIAIEDSKIIF